MPANGNYVTLKFEVATSSMYHFRLMWNVKPDWESRNYKFLGPMERSIKPLSTCVERPKCNTARLRQALSSCRSCWSTICLRWLNVSSSIVLCAHG